MKRAQRMIQTLDDSGKEAERKSRRACDLGQSRSVRCELQERVDPTGTIRSISLD